MWVIDLGRARVLGDLGRCYRVVCVCVAGGLSTSENGRLISTVGFGLACDVECWVLYRC